MSNEEMQFEEVDAGGWVKFTEAGQVVEGTFVEHFTKPAQGQFGEQIVAVLSNDGSISNVGFPTTNAKYVNSVRSLKPGHRVRVTLSGFYNQDKGELVTQPGKTKKGTNFAKSYSIQQATTPDSNYVAPNTKAHVDDLGIDDIPF